MATPTTLVLLAKRPSPELRARIAAGEEPTPEYLKLVARLDAELLDFHDVDRSRHPLVRFLARRMGASWGLAALGMLRRKEFDNLYATGEDVGLPLAIMLRALGSYGKLTMVAHHAGTAKRRKVFRAVGSRVYRCVVCLNSEQERILADEIGLSSEKVRRVNHWTDHEFFRPKGLPGGDFVLSVGMESRDYQTLQRAAGELPLRFHVVASGWSPDAGFAAAAGIRDGENILVERGVSTERLVELYDRARFVVVPLKRVSLAAGVTAITEAMAMGKAVVATDSPGIRDYVADGQSGRVVPVADAAALRDAIHELWSDPAATRRMGERNRAWIEEAVNTDRYVEEIAGLLQVGA